MAHQNGRVHALDQHQLEVPTVYALAAHPSAGLDAPAQISLDLARWVLAWETRDARETSAVTTAAERACQKLLERLARLITPNGCQALMSRAVHLARVDFAFLAEVEPGTTASAYVKGLATSGAGLDVELVGRGVASLLARLMELVALFIGDYLTGRVLREVWPELPVQASTGQQPASTEPAP
jgi:hypothetical protein